MSRYTWFLHKCLETQAILSTLIQFHLKRYKFQEFSNINNGGFGLSPTSWTTHLMYLLQHQCRNEGSCPLLSDYGLLIYFSIAPSLWPKVSHVIEWLAQCYLISHCFFIWTCISKKLTPQKWVESTDCFCIYLQTMCVLHFEHQWIGWTQVCGLHSSHACLTVGHLHHAWALQGEDGQLWQFYLEANPL